MGPTNDHELQIAREVDKHSLRDDLSLDVIPEILAFLDFRLSNTDAAFLDQYVQWRIENPAVK